MMRFFRSTKLLYQLVVAFLIIGLLPVFLSTRHLVDLTRTEMRYKLKDSHTDRSLDSARELGQQLQMVFNTLATLGESVTRARQGERRQEGLIEALLDSFTQGWDVFDHLVVRTLDFELYTSSRTKHEPSVAFRNAFLDKGVFSLVAEGGIFLSDLGIHATTENLEVTIGIPLSSVNGPTGALYAEVNLEWVRRVVRAKSFGVEGITFTVDRRGRCFARSDLTLAKELPDCTGRESVRAVLQRSLRGATHYEDATGRDYLVAYAPIPNPLFVGHKVPFDWGLVVQEPTEQAYVLAKKMTSQSVLYGWITAILAIIAAAAAAYGISTPVRLLTEGAERFGEGRFDERIQIRSKNEIGRLARSFNEMAGKIQDYTKALKKKAEEIQQLFLQSIGALAEAIDAKDPYTRGHSQRVANYSKLIAIEIGLDGEEREQVYLSALLHDVGKVGIPDAILNKPGPLTTEEYEVMKQHPVLGAKIMCQIRQLEPIIPGMLQHHERWDGSGYPEGLLSDEISLAARIIGVADTFDAMTTNRPYQRKMRDDVAINIIRGLNCKRYDPEVVDAFLRAYITFDKPDKVDIYEVLGHEEARRVGITA